MVNQTSFCHSELLSIIRWHKLIALSAPGCSVWAITLFVTRHPHLSIHQGRGARWHLWLFACLTIIRREVLRVKPAACDPCSAVSQTTPLWQETDDRKRLKLFSTSTGNFQMSKGGELSPTPKLIIVGEPVYFGIHGRLSAEGIWVCAQGQCFVAFAVAPQGFLVDGWSFQSVLCSASLNAINREGFHKDFVGLCICACLRMQKYDWNNAPPTVFVFMCVPRVAATFRQIFIPGVKHSWSLSPVYSPVLSPHWLSHWPLFIPIESDRRAGTKRHGEARPRPSEHGARSGVETDRQRQNLVWKWGKWVFALMDDLSSNRNQKPNLPNALVAKAHSVVMQGGPSG